MEDRIKELEQLLEECQENEKDAWEGLDLVFELVKKFSTTSRLIYENSIGVKKN